MKLSVQQLNELKHLHWRMHVDYSDHENRDLAHAIATMASILGDFCENCSGSGDDGRGRWVCPECGGTGKRPF